MGILPAPLGVQPCCPGSQPHLGAQVWLGLISTSQWMANLESQTWFLQGPYVFYLTHAAFISWVTFPCYNNSLSSQHQPLHSAAKGIGCHVRLSPPVSWLTSCLPKLGRLRTTARGFSANPGKFSCAADLCFRLLWLAWLSWVFNIAGI